MKLGAGRFVRITVEQKGVDLTLALYAADGKAIISLNDMDDSRGRKTLALAIESDPKGSIAYQFELLKVGDADKLRNYFAESQRERITRERVDKAKENVSKYTLDDLYAWAKTGESEGKKIVKVKMKNGRTLIAPIQTDGKWLSDTVWFD